MALKNEENPVLWKKIFLFFAVNTVGFFSVSLCYALGLYTNAIPEGTSPLDVANFNRVFFMGTIMTWFVCAVFSFAYFFLEGRARLFFLWAPVFIPILYGLSVLY